MLATKGISKQFEGVRAIHDLSVSFEAGKITGVIGPNGSGKSTLVNVLTGMIPFDQGVIILEGKERISKLDSVECPDLGITRTFQEVRLFEQMTVLDNILVVITERTVTAGLFETHKKYHLSLAEKVLQKVGIWEFKDKSARNLSYGQRKLLEIARVLAMKEIGDANIIFFDEPYAGLFPEMIKIVSTIIKELKAEGSTIILIEHNMELIRELSDHVIVMDSGELLAEGKPETVLAQRNVIEAYLGE